MESPQRTNWLNLLKQSSSIAFPYLVSEEKVGAWSLVGLVGLSALLAFPIGPVINSQLGEMTSALIAYDRARLGQAVLLFCGGLFIMVIGLAGLQYSLYLLLLYWRQWLTRRVLGQYFSNRAYYKLTWNPKIDNPDQRIAQDIIAFTGGILLSGFLFLIVAPGLAVFPSIALWGRFPTLVIILLLYGSVNLLIGLGGFAGNLTRLNFQQLKKEADFRSGLLRIRDNAEAIAFYQGEARESEQIGQRFDRVFENKNRLLLWNDVYLKSFDTLVKAIPLLIPLLFLAPRIVSGELEVGVLAEVEGNAGAISGAFGILISVFGVLARMFASIERIEALVRELEKSQTVPVEGTTLIDSREDEALNLSHLTLQTPDYKQTLLRDLSVTVPQGSGLLVVGESGSGKSSLLRAIAGLWLSGTGLITRPKLSEMLFLSQRPYMILGTLRDQLLYPHANKEVTEEQLRQALCEVNLADLPERVGGFDVEADWAAMLSPGEQQRLAFARVLINQPRYAVLDESTSALDVKNEARLYQRLRETNTTFVSVGHRPSLVKYHDSVLQIGPNQGWEVIPAADYEPE